MSIVIFIIVLVVLILVHEFGHFVAAKLSGMRVDEFGIGFPPKVWGFTWGETLYSINALPLGGFVRIHGEDPSPEGAGQVPGGGELADSRSFTSRPKIFQILVLLAGIGMNFVLAWLIFSALLMTSQWIGPNLISSPEALFPALIHGASVTYQVTIATVQALGAFFWGLITLTADWSQVSGPVGIANAVGQASQNGWSDLLTLTALISINLAVINVIPIPALDGGRLFFVLLETALRRPLNARIVNTVNATGFVLLLLLVALVSVHDIYKLLT